PELAGRDALISLLVLVDDRIDPGRSCTASLAERHFLAGNVLQLDGHMLENVTEPGPLILAHAAQKPAGLAVRAAVFGQTGKCCDEPLDERVAEAARGPLLQSSQIELEPDDRKARVQGWANVDRTIEDAHGAIPLGPMPCGSGG